MRNGAMSEKDDVVMSQRSAGRRQKVRHRWEVLKMIDKEVLFIHFLVLK